MTKGYLLVYTTSCAFYCEELMKPVKGMVVKLVPTPREYSSDCGIAVYFEYEFPETLEELLQKHHLEYELKLLSTISDHPF
ncbi:MAG: DUF3343 domain-containing protein [Sulfurospirillaceae bacterium]|nr:DUF3343 domain-containing protein [Sulfurospirillaceae bacterium]